VLQSIRTLSENHPDVPVIGSITGPISTAASLVDPISFLKELRRNRRIHTEWWIMRRAQILELARFDVENGADTITIADPTATGEILGPKLFEAYAVPYLNKVIAGIHAMGKPVIVHICGNIDAVTKHLPALQSDALSTDAMVNMRLLKEQFPDLVTMGKFEYDPSAVRRKAKVENQTVRLLNDHIDIIAPACGLSTSTPLDNITAMTDVVKQV